MLTTDELQTAINANFYPPANVTSATFVAWRETKMVEDARLEAEWVDWLNHTYLPDATDNVRYAVLAQAKDDKYTGEFYPKIEERFKSIAELVNTLKRN